MRKMPLILRLRRWIGVSDDTSSPTTRLRNRIASADRVAVIYGGMSIESQDSIKIQRLADCLEARSDPPDFKGTMLKSHRPVVKVFDAQDAKPFVTLTNIGGHCVRITTDDSITSMEIANPEQWLSWFESCGLDGPREEAERQFDKYGGAKHKLLQDHRLTPAPVESKNQGHSPTEHS